MKKIAIAFGIIACLAVLSLLLTSASAQGEEEYWMTCPSRDGGDLHVGASSYRDPVRVEYMRTISGAGKEDIATTIATHDGFSGIAAVLSARGTGITLSDSQTITIDSEPSNPKLDITSDIEKEYAPVTILGRNYDSLLAGEICTKNYMAGAVVSDRYRDTETIAGDYTHEGTGTYSNTKLNKKTLGTTRFAVTVKNPDAHHHTVMRSREEHIGLYNISREVNVVVYP